MRRCTISCENYILWSASTDVSFDCPYIGIFFQYLLNTIDFILVRSKVCIQTEEMHTFLLLWLHWRTLSIYISFFRSSTIMGIKRTEFCSICGKISKSLISTHTESFLTTQVSMDYLMVIVKFLYFWILILAWTICTYTIWWLFNTRQPTKDTPLSSLTRHIHLKKLNIYGMGKTMPLASQKSNLHILVYVFTSPHPENARWRFFLCIYSSMHFSSHPASNIFQAYSEFFPMSIFPPL